MKANKVDSKEMELRNNKDVTAAKKMGAEGGPPVHSDKDVTNSKSKDSDQKE